VPISGLKTEMRTRSGPASFKTFSVSTMSAGVSPGLPTIKYTLAQMPARRVMRAASTITSGVRSFLRTSSMRWLPDSQP
jgi:hypothetical protein